MTGHYGVSAWHHYAAVTAPEVLDMYTCAMLGSVLGGAGGKSPHSAFAAILDRAGILGLVLDESI